MSDWLHNLPVPLMALVIFGFTYLLAAVVFLSVALAATEERAKSLKAISPGMLPVLGIIFGLFVAFTAAQVWGDSDRAGAAVSREASALRSAVLLAAGLPTEQEAKLRGLVRDYVGQAVTVEWPEMAHQEASLKATPPALAAALQLVVTMAPQGRAQGDHAARDRRRAGAGAGCAAAADHRQPGLGQFGEMVVPVSPGPVRAAGDRLRSLRQPPGIGDCDGPVRNRRRHLGAPDRGARPPVHRPDIDLAGAAAPDHAGSDGGTELTAPAISLRHYERASVQFSIHCTPKRSVSLP